ncbi:MAG: ATP-binding cassette domain-containing protein [Armatimonadetes bacterium]|nr:ATP-binding cassette domain-containing protein [Armatimonadota bacterium]NIM24591.1 ATP-binding cassette domain-containing protein [Armatimonadota bacterium]NIM68467.1 ATP-binding cassette domain-containing protein [Armatimonadota bacterium]NIM76853.1 ATP-binding cassette domain-containing protein [Armatimonadota bacterium]NIN06664.1 ATP-binding cassette domain-containing protein [Armatimonadota bacterium]
MLTIEHLRKDYGNLTAVKDLSLHLEKGDVYGFIGPNGAGKTTTIKVCATLLEPTQGKVYVEGFDVTKKTNEVRGMIGYMPDFFGVYDDIMVWEYLDFFAAAYKIPRERRQTIIDDVLELTDLTGKRDIYVEALSRGMKQRLCLAKTLLHDPKVLLLDEPASGLDPRARVEIKELLKELKTMGKTILVSSHILPELADFCNKIGIIEQGELIVSGDVGEIMRKVQGGKGLQITLLADVEKAVALLSQLPKVKSVEQDNLCVCVQFSTDEVENSEVLQLLIKNGLQVQSFSETQVDLEDIFMKVTRGVVS